MKLIRFKDNTYTWVGENGAADILSEASVKANGVWQYKLPKDAIERAITQLKERQHDVATFSLLFKDLIKTEKQTIPLIID